jgi:hypothetical protein
MLGALAVLWPPIRTFDPIRALIELVGYCRSHAVNLGRERIAQEDIAHGEATFSVELLTNISFELRDVFPSAKDVLYEFLESPGQLSGRDILEALGRVVGDEEETRQLFEVLLWYGIFGLVRDGERVSYRYDVNYDIKRLLRLAARPGDDATFRLNPAFWRALEVET